MSHERSATAGMRKTATCAADASAISAARAIFPPSATTTAPPCSAAFPTMATITAATKNSREAGLLCEHVERADEDLGDEGGDRRRDRERAERPRSDHPSISSSDATCIVVCRRSEYQVTAT